MIGVCSVGGIPLVTVIRKTVMVNMVEIAKDTLAMVIINNMIAKDTALILPFRKYSVRINN